MGGFSLAQYIDEQLKKGFTKEQVTQYLVRYGYSGQQVLAAIESLESKPLLSRIFHKKRLPDPRLVNYIRYYISKGYDTASITGYLRQYNYGQEDIDEAVRSANRQEPHIRHVIDISTRTFVLLFLIVSATVGGGFGIYHLLNSGGPMQLLDYEISLRSNEVMPGDTLYFTNSFFNLGSERKYDMQASYMITDADTGEMLNSKQETIGISTVISKEQQIFMPTDAKPGMYRLDGSVHYGKQTANASVNFWISQPDPEETCTDGILNQDEEMTDCGGSCLPCKTEAVPTCNDRILNQDELKTDCGGVCPPCKTEAVPTCNDRILNQDELKTDCGGVCPPCKTEAVPTCNDGILNQDEVKTDCGGVCLACADSPVRPDNKQILEKVSGIGNSDEPESLRLCNIIDDERMGDDCYLMISQAYGQSDYCADIRSESKLNICYMHFLNQEDYTVCDKISDVYVKRSCEQLKNIRAIEKSQGNTTATAVS